MLSNCLKCKNITESKNRNFSKTSNGKIMLSSNCAVRNRKRFKIYQRRTGQRVFKPVKN